MESRVGIRVLATGGLILIATLFTVGCGGFSSVLDEQIRESGDGSGVRTRVGDPRFGDDDGSGDDGGDGSGGPGDGPGDGDDPGGPGDDDDGDGDDDDPLTYPHTESFTQSPFDRFVDILFVVDDSGSMSDEQANLATNFTSMIQVLVSRNYDFHVGVISTDVDNVNDSGRLNGTPTFMELLTPNLMTEFQEAAQVGLNGSGSERGLEAARLALSEPLASGHNAGFVRADVPLTIIFVADEDDNSHLNWDREDRNTPADIADRTPSDYVAAFTALKNGQVEAHAIVATDSDYDPANPEANYACANGNIYRGWHNVGTRYMEVAQSLGGAVRSICEADYGPVLEEIALNIVRNDKFFLTNIPVDGTIEVRVNGALEPSANYSYVESSKSVIFGADHIPLENSSVEITYQSLTP